jgi:hypothetical protein
MTAPIGFAARYNRYRALSPRSWLPANDLLPKPERSD